MSSVILDPDQVAHCEAAGWRAYYDRQWLNVLKLMVTLAQKQFHIPFPVSLVAAYYVTRASILYAPVEHDTARVLAYLRSFYRLARRYSGLHFDPTHVARIELQYFEVHRRLAEEPDKQELVGVFVDLHSATFGISPQAAHESAVARTEAVTIVDSITHHKSTDIDGDWVRIEAALRRCYESIKQRLAEVDASASREG